VEPAGPGRRPDEAWNRRYSRARTPTFRECAPWDRASLVIDIDHLAAPFIGSLGDVKMGT
jgi:hypothetical protein